MQNRSVGYCRTLRKIESEKKSFKKFLTCVADEMDSHSREEYPQSVTGDVHDNDPDQDHGQVRLGPLLLLDFLRVVGLRAGTGCCSAPGNGHGRRRSGDLSPSPVSHRNGPSDA
jgi:hypothetical protein